MRKHAKLRDPKGRCANEASRRGTSWRVVKQGMKTREEGEGRERNGEGGSYVAALIYVPG